MSEPTVDAANLLQELQANNDALRWLCEFLYRDKKRLLEEVRKERLAVEKLQAESDQLKADLSGIDQQSREFTTRYVAVEEQNTRLANLYVASDRLHSTLDRASIIEAIQEIVINLVGSEELALFDVDGAQGLLRLVSSFGVDPAPLQEIPLGEGPIGRAAAGGRLYLGTSSGNGNGAAECHASALSACIPLKVDGRVTGAIAVFRLLPQKGSLGPEDVELFDLLASQAAQALYCATLHAQQAKVAS